MIGARADVEKRTLVDGSMPLHLAAQLGYLDIVELLLGSLADKDQVKNDGSTALQWAARGGHQDVVQLLLKNRADVSQIIVESLANCG